VFSYDIVEQVEQTNVPLASFRASWALSVPIFHDVAAAYSDHLEATRPGIIGDRFGLGAKRVALVLGRHAQVLRGLK
jgi:hypothetical protein